MWSLESNIPRYFVPVRGFLCKVYFFLVKALHTSKQMSHHSFFFTSFTSPDSFLSFDVTIEKKTRSFTSTIRATQDMRITRNQIQLPEVLWQLSDDFSDASLSTTLPRRKAFSHLQVIHDVWFLHMCLSSSLIFNSDLSNQVWIEDSRSSCFFFRIHFFLVSRRVKDERHLKCLASSAAVRPPA